ncbi:MAG TPA: hypothetical protein VGQ62_12860, partial [Chloroflexota bacterium]|nr:hypothetical protein [Chloroflexota bacterium]
MTAATELHHEGEAIERAARHVRWWPPIMAFLVVGVAYALVSDRLTVGPKWALFGVVAVAIGAAWFLRRRGMIYAGRYVAMAALVTMTAAL